ncbi:FAD-dependent monooxygenase [Nocardia gipuzkoensis]|uniref:FAD-dependent monooxygenase n=1 Tax=Nocardia gipuzkoensis TaxID=2749991 RepID=UPI00237D9080|nr:FAD-dependent monooxygenase [Nocardia gipuzkoensis]MDE1675213.1 FAD-dependent monooxygenase [Nocardia gipuzkoensis]
MSVISASDHRVVVVGAGAAGLMTALELWRWGVPCLVIDKRRGPASNSAAITLHSSTREDLEAVGLASDIDAAGIPSYSMDYHFKHAKAVDGGQAGPRLDFTRLKPPTYPTNYSEILNIPQRETERILRERLESLGCEILWGTELRKLTCDEYGCVTATFVKPCGEVEIIRPEWLVGCDGVYSTVRRQLGIEFVGTSYDNDLCMTDTVIWGLPLPRDRLHYLICDQRLIFLAALPSDPKAPLFRVIVGELGSGGPRTNNPHALFQTALDVHFGGAIIVDEPKSTPTQFTLGQRLATRFIHPSGHVILCGDAAHTQTIAGGMGLNLALQDAINLAAKLAMVVQGLANPSLLHSYEPERRQAAVQAGDIARRIHGVIMDPRTPLEQRVATAAELNDDAVGLISGHRLNYRGTAGRIPGLTALDGLAAGDRAPNIAITRNQRVHDQANHYYTLLGVQAEPDSAAVWTTLAREVESRFGQRVRFTLVTPPGVHTLAPVNALMAESTDFHEVYGVRGRNSLCLLRSDRHVDTRCLHLEHDALLNQLGTVLT